MNRKVVSDKQAIYLISILLIGSSSIMVMGIQAKKDAWLSILLGMLLAFPITLIYARLHSIFPKNNLFDIAEICFGKFIGKIICLLYVWFTLHNASLILENIGSFINTVSLDETPILVPKIFMTILCVIIVKQGIVIISDWVEFFFPVIIFLLGVLFILLVPKMDINNILPILNNGLKPILGGAISVFSFPFAETYVFTMIFYNMENKKSPYKVYLYGLLMGGFIMCSIALTNLLLLGEYIVSLSYYPTYLAAERINFFNTIQRIEVLIAIVLILGAFAKISIFLFASCKGLAKVFNLTNYKFIVFPMGLMIIVATYFQNHNTMEIFEFANNIWPFYSSIFEVILPVTIWFGSELHITHIK
ncbi:MAG: endospore germination permease [Tepidibacter sp.]|jgi:spore germination protein KB|uniref:GerAB/ArcD/ProY family transporter n=1 Tax=Tepidibacter sp. TaxID=2529387 RepID=UPI0025F9637C|nr:endospore germination permease [Tepidibacter sp.]MCT4508897.1 endospore germination permease [Tepidibacter sp.]